MPGAKTQAKTKPSATAPIKDRSTDRALAVRGSSHAHCQDNCAHRSRARPITALPLRLHPTPLSPPPLLAPPHPANQHVTTAPKGTKKTSPPSLLRPPPDSPPAQTTMRTAKEELVESVEAGVSEPNKTKHGTKGKKGGK
ncbi:hypothetical protein FRC08_011331 [Ceratobasidium sp. 394]|nr:hypothetical protein FRC08_011331 [Ceratobasidium sp. 394]